MVFFVRGKVLFARKWRLLCSKVLGGIKTYNKICLCKYKHILSATGFAKRVFIRGHSWKTLSCVGLINSTFNLAKTQWAFVNRIYKCTYITVRLSCGDLSKCNPAQCQQVILNIVSLWDAEQVGAVWAEVVSCWETWLRWIAQVCHGAAGNGGELWSSRLIRTGQCCFPCMSL